MDLDLITFKPTVITTDKLSKEVNKTFRRLLDLDLTIDLGIKLRKEYQGEQLNRFTVGVLSAVRTPLFSLFQKPFFKKVAFFLSVNHLFDDFWLVYLINSIKKPAFSSNGYNYPTDSDFIV